jgi:5-methylcytosine-specific restriction endonuclease McrA
LAVKQAPLSSSQKSEVLRRQAFKCAQCQTDLEPVGREPPHFELVTAAAGKGAPGTANFQALCPACHAKSSSETTRVSDEKKRRQRDSGPAQSAKKFVKSGFDTRKF